VVLDSTVIFVSGSRRTYDHILLSQGSGSPVTPAGSRQHSLSCSSNSAGFMTIAPHYTVKVTFRPTASRPVLSWCQAPIWGPRPDFYFQTVAGLLMCGASLTRREVCRLQLLLALASAVILGSDTIFYCFRFEAPPTWRARFPYLYPPGTRWSCYSRRHRVTTLP
jgi:hypothetical protein